MIYPIAVINHCYASYLVSIKICNIIMLKWQRQILTRNQILHCLNSRQNQNGHYHRAVEEGHCKGTRSTEKKEEKGKATRQLKMINLQRRHFQSPVSSCPAFAGSWAKADLPGLPRAVSFFPSPVAQSDPWGFWWLIPPVIIKRQKSEKQKEILRASPFLKLFPPRP